MQKSFPVLFILLFFAFGSKAQDIHFSQFYIMTANENPAKIGIMNGNYRANVIYRSQWKSVTTPFTTSMMSAELSMGAGKRGRNDIVGLAFAAASDKAGDAHLNSSLFTIAGSYAKSVGRLQKQLISGGIELGVFSATLDYANLHFDEQYNGGALTENLTMQSAKYFDISLGVAYTQEIFRFSNLSFGGAVFHVNNPSYSFLNNSSSHIFRKYVLSSGADIRIDKNHSLYPRAYFEKQGPSNELVFGLFGRAGLNFGVGNQDAGFYIGAFYRLKDAIITSFRVDIDHFSMTFSYDFNLSKLTKISTGAGGPEFSMTWIGSIHGFAKKGVYCPRF